MDRKRRKLWGSTQSQRSQAVCQKLGAVPGGWREHGCTVGESLSVQISTLHWATTGTFGKVGQDQALQALEAEGGSSGLNPLVTHWFLRLAGRALCLPFQMSQVCFPCLFFKTTAKWVTNYFLHTTQALLSFWLCWCLSWAIFLSLLLVQIGRLASDTTASAHLFSISSLGPTFEAHLHSYTTLLTVVIF